MSERLLGGSGALPSYRPLLVPTHEAPGIAGRRAGLEFVEKLLPAMIWVGASVAGLTRRLTGLVP